MKSPESAYPVTAMVTADVAALNMTPLLLVNVALRSADPSSWACVTPTAHAALNHKTFELEWFLQWHPVLLPHRPWQYAVLTWRRMAGAAPGHIARFMLRVLHAKQQQRLQQPQQPQHKAKQQQRQQQQVPQQQQQPAQAAAPQPAPVSVATRERYAVQRSVEGQFYGLYPDLQPLPCTVRKVHKLLARLEAAADMQALLLLCPCPTLLLCQYATRSATTAVEADLCLRKDTSSTTSSNSSSGCDSNSNQAPAMPLLQRLMQHVGASGSGHDYWSSVYNLGYLNSSDIRGKEVSAMRLGCQAALAAGQIPSLLWALPSAMSETRRRTRKPLLLTVLLPYAARYSNAACLRAVLMQFSPFDRAAVLAPQHLAMAAGRTDPWALGVVQLIMGLLAPRQLKPSHMRAAYMAAWSSGYLPILQELVHHAAKAPQWHMPVLVQAAADSSNMLAVQLLLGDAAEAHAALAALQARHSSASSVQQQPAREGHSQQQQRAREGNSHSQGQQPQQSPLPDAAAAWHSVDTSALSASAQHLPAAAHGNSQCQDQQSSPLAASAAAEHLTETAVLLGSAQQLPAAAHGNSQCQQQQHSCPPAAPAGAEHCADSSGLWASIQQLRAAVGDLSPEAAIYLLQYCLPHMQYFSSLDILPNPDLEAIYLYCADRVWQLLPADRQQQLRTACLNSSVRAVGGPKNASTPEERAEQAEFPLRRRQVLAYAALQHNKQPSAYAWLLQHELLPARLIHDMFWQELDTARGKAVKGGLGVHMQPALQLHRHMAAVQATTAQQTEGGNGPGASTGRCGPLGGYSAAKEVMQGRLAAACAACDAAAVAQIELCHQLCYALQTPPPLDHAWLPVRPATTVYTVPTLPVSRAGGRLATIAHLSAGLGLPWPLLGTLLAAAGYHNLGFLPGAVQQAAHAAVSAGSGGVSTGVGSSSSGCQQLLFGCNSIEQQLQDARLAVQDVPAAVQQGVLRVDPCPNQGILPSFTQDGWVASHRLAASLSVYGYDMLLPRGGETSHRSRMQLASERLLQFLLADLQRASRTLVQLDAAFWQDLLQLKNQQEQIGPPPLWLQCLLQHAANSAPGLRQLPAPGQPFPRCGGLHMSSVVHQGLVLFHGLQAGRSAQEVQDFVSNRLLQDNLSTSAPAVVPYAIWGVCILRQAIQHRAPGLLAWSLQPERQQLLWGDAPDAVPRAVADLLTEEVCSPITCRCLRLCRMAEECRPHGMEMAYSLQREAQQQDLLQMHKGREALLGPGSSSSSCGPMVAAAGPLPQFAAEAVQLAMAILQHPGMPAHTLNNWLQRTLGTDSTLPDIVRARAIVASVAASEVIPVGAGVCRKEAVQKVLAVGDPDLWSAVLLWCHRLPIRVDEEQVGIPVGDDDDDDGGDDGFADADPALVAAAQQAVAQLAAAMNAVNV